MNLAGAAVRSLTDPEASREAQRDARKHPFALEIVGDPKKNHLFEADSTEDLMSPRRAERLTDLDPGGQMRYGWCLRVFRKLRVAFRAFSVYVNI